MFSLLATVATIMSVGCAASALGIVIKIFM